MEDKQTQTKLISKKVNIKKLKEENNRLKEENNRLIKKNNFLRLSIGFSATVATLTTIGTGICAYKDYKNCEKYNIYINEKKQFINDFKNIKMTTLCNNNKNSIYSWLEREYGWGGYFNTVISKMNINGLIFKQNNNRFCGIILFEIKKDFIYVHLVYSSNHYRKTGLPMGKILLANVEIYSHNNNIYKIKLEPLNLKNVIKFYIDNGYQFINDYLMNKILLEKGYLQKPYDFITNISNEDTEDIDFED